MMRCASSFCTPGRYANFSVAEVSFFASFKIRRFWGVTGMFFYGESFVFRFSIFFTFSFYFRIVVQLLIQTCFHMLCAASFIVKMWIFSEFFILVRLFNFCQKFPCKSPLKWKQTLYHRPKQIINFTLYVTSPWKKNIRVQWLKN